MQCRLPRPIALHTAPFPTQQNQQNYQWSEEEVNAKLDRGGAPCCAHLPPARCCAAPCHVCRAF